MKAGEEKFMTIINKPIQFKIPIFQRKYDWGTDHCQTLIDDIDRLLNYPKNPIHFMGSIVYVDEEGYTRVGGTQELLLIDGQQRITTFTLIFIILEKLARGQDKKELAREIRDTCLINKYSKLSNKNKLILTKKDNEILEKYLRGEEPDEESNIVTNHKYLKTKFSDMINDFSVEDIYTVLNKIMIVDVCLFYGQDDPQQIFESLNATGKTLESGDLIRNFILMNLTQEIQNNIYNSYWEKMESLLGDELNFFLENYLYMRKGVTTTIKDLYKEFKLFFHKNHSHEKVEKIASDLLKYSEHYIIISQTREGKDNRSEVNKALADLEKLGIWSYYPLLLRIFDEYKEGKLDDVDLVDNIRVIESFMFRRSICNISTRSLSPIFRTLWDKLDHKNLNDSLIKELKSGKWNKEWPDDVKFKEQLIDGNLYRQKYCKILLEELEKFSNKEANKDFENLQIEHVLPRTDDDPEKLSEGWKKMLGKNYKEIRNKWVHTLGNLTLTGYNPELSDKNFDEKKTMENGFIESGLRLNKKIAEYPVWNGDSIEDRAKKLANTAVKRWSYFK